MFCSGSSNASGPNSAWSLLLHWPRSLPSRLSNSSCRSCHRQRCMWPRICVGVTQFVLDIGQLDFDTSAFFVSKKMPGSMEAPIDAGGSRGEESREEMLAKLVFINAVIANAKKERTRLFEKIARMMGDPDDPESNPDIASTSALRTSQVQEFKMAASVASHDHSSGLEDDLGESNVTRQDSKDQANDVGDLSTKAQEAGENYYGQSLSDGYPQSSDVGGDIKIEEKYWTIHNPPSSDHFPDIRNELGVPVVLPACVRRAPAQQKPQNSPSAGAAGDKQSRAGNPIYREAIPFTAIVDLHTIESYISSSFVFANVTAYDVFSGKSRRTAFAVPHPPGVKFTFDPRYEPKESDASMPPLEVSGSTDVPIKLEGYLFWARCVVCERIFVEEEYDKKFTAVLGLRFLARIHAQLQVTSGGWLIRLPPPPPTAIEISNLIVNISGCVARDSKCGYSLHFPTLPDGWDVQVACSHYGHGATLEILELSAVVEALHLVFERLILSCEGNWGTSKLRCKRVSICTTSNYIVASFQELLPRWRQNGFRSVKKKRPVLNGDYWEAVEYHRSSLASFDTAVTLTKVTTQNNQVADKLAQEAALHESSHPGKGDFVMRKYFLNGISPLAQLSPDGLSWRRNDVLQAGAAQKADDAEETREDAEELQRNDGEVGKIARK